MNDVAVNMALIGRLIRWRWPLLLALVIVGAAAGAGASTVLSPGYVSTTKVLLQGSRDATQLPAETQVATSLIVLDRTAQDLGWGVTGAQLRHQVSALVDGNVITISGAADTPQRAQQLAAHLTTEYINFSTQIVTDVANATADSTQKSRQTIQQHIDDANKRINELQSSPSINAPGPVGDQARNELQQVQQTITKASKDLEQIDGAAESAAVDSSLGASSATLIELATLPGSPGTPTLVECVLGGGLTAFLLGLLAHLVALRADRRLRVPDEVGSAVGAPVIGTVEVVLPASARPSMLRRLLRDDRRWAFTGQPVVEDDRGRGARYLRMLRRLEPGAAETLIVVTLDEDRAARVALVGLSVAAAVDGGRVALVTTDDDLGARVAAAVPSEAGGRITVGPGAPAATCTFVDVRVAAARPVIPEMRRADGAVLLVSAGSCTGWELAGVAGACIDARQRLRGVVVVLPGSGRGADPGSPTPADSPATPGDQPMAATS